MNAKQLIGITVIVTCLGLMSACATSTATQLPAAPTASPVNTFCTDQNTGVQLSYDEAVEIARGSECGRQGQLKSTYFCNETTGTWWIDLNIDKPGCSPACVVDVNKRMAEINWRCTGLLQPTPISRQPATQSVSPTLMSPGNSTDWKTYTNQQFGYSFQYPGDAEIQSEDPNRAVQVIGPLVNNEWWPVFFVAHPDTEFFRPPAGVDLQKWLSDKGMLRGEVKSSVQIAGLPAVHLRSERSPQSYGADRYYFARDGQLFEITILHAGKEDWELYNRFLSSLTF